jgi:cytochrome c556
VHGPTKWVSAAAFAAAALFAGAGNVSAQGAGGGGGAAQAPPDPPAIAYRKAMMASNGPHLAAIRAQLASGGAGNWEDVEKHAEAVANNGLMWGTMWPAGSTGPTSRAMDEIWSKPDEFAARVKAFADATVALKAAADKEDSAATLAAAQGVQATCGACHMPFRKPAPPATPR